MRINPYELHINTPGYYSVLYAGPTRKRAKDGCFSFVGLPNSTFSAASHQLHRLRRNSLNPFFSKSAILAYEPVIREKVGLLVDNLAKTIEKQELVELHAAFACFAVDTVSTYTFGAEHCFGYLDAPNLTDDWKAKVNSVFEMLLLVRHIPILVAFARTFPRFSAWLVPQYVHVNRAEAVGKIIRIEEGQLMEVANLFDC